MLDPFDGDTRPVLGWWVEPDKGLLERRQGDHLSAGLQEALEPPAKPQVAVGVELTQVAAHIPMLSVFFHERRPAVMVEVAGEDRRPTDLDHAHPPRRERRPTFQIDDAHG